VLVTPDKNIRYQQNLVLRRIAFVVLSNPQWSLQRSQVLFCGVVLGEPSPDATSGIIDQADEMASRIAILRPTERRAVLPSQLPETGSSLAPHMGGLYSL
jgi:hypothetical protein